MVKRQNKEKAKQALGIAARKMLDKKLNVIIFPEGTRNWGKPLPFKLGAFNLAIEAQAPIQPVAYARYPEVLDQKKFRTGTVKIKCLEPISTVGLTQDDAKALAEKCQRMIEEESLRLTRESPGYKGQLSDQV